MAILIAGFLVSTVFTAPAKAASEDYCTDSLRKADHSQVDLITKSLTNRIKIGDSFVVLIENFDNDYGITYVVNILKQGTLVSTKTGSLENMNGIGNIASPEMFTSGFKTAEYTVKVKIYHKDEHCLLRMETFPIEMILTNDTSKPDGVDFFDKGDVVIGVTNKEVNVGDHFPISIENKSDINLIYDIKVNDLKTGDFVTKTVGEVTKGENITAWANIMSVGNHKLKVDLVDPNTAENLLYTQTFEIAVGDSTTGVASLPEEPGSTGGSLGNSQPTTNSDGDGITPTLGKIFKAIFPSSGAADADLSSINKLIVQVTDYALSFAGIVAFVMVLWAARALLNSYGSEESFVMAKKTLTWALVGLLVILISKGLLNWVVCFLTTTGTCK